MSSCFMVKAFTTDHTDNTDFFLSLSVESVQSVVRSVGSSVVGLSHDDFEGLGGGMGGEVDGGGGLG